MKNIVLLSLLWSFSFIGLLAQEGSAESFISDYEYGEMLFTNPRGVSCMECHGNSGEGKVIVEYSNAKGKQIIRGADIRLKSLSEMIIAVNSSHKVMPRYYLTDEEVKAIYEFLKTKNAKYVGKE